MAHDTCTHINRVPAVVDLDFARVSDSKSRLTHPVRVHICEDCGHIDLYCIPRQQLCEWLLAISRSGTRAEDG